MADFVRVQKEDGKYITINKDIIQSVELEKVPLFSRNTSKITTKDGTEILVKGNPEDVTRNS